MANGLRWRILTGLLTAALALLPPPPVRASSATETAPAAVSVTADGVVELGGGWRVRVGDDPRFSRPDFDDSGWPELRGGDRLAGKVPVGRGPGYLWARKHVLLLPHGPDPLGLALETRRSLPYEIFAGGQRIAESPGMRARALHRVTPFAAPLPAGTDMVIAVRFYYPATFAPRTVPIAGARVGRLSLLRLTTDLAALRAFDEDHVAEVVAVGLCVGLAVFASVLFALQRSRAEYLWLGLFCLFYALCASLKIRVESGSVDATMPFILFYRYAGCATLVCALEFVLHFVQARAKLAVRGIEALFLLVPLLSFVDEMLFGVCLVLLNLLLFVLVARYLVVAYRRGMVEVKLLLPFLALLVLVNVFFYGSQFGAELLGGRVLFPSRLQVGTVGVGMEDLTVLFFLGGVMGLVLYRFNRVTREEQRSTGEFEAARNVQRTLIPEQLPEVPGFAVSSVYRPAREVGGDFVQVLPLPDGTGGLFVLGDVSGKGMEAAMTVAVIVGALRTLAEQTGSPADLLRGLNRRLLERGGGFTTCVIVRLLATGEALLSNAGHLDVYLDGTPVEADRGLPLGLVADAEFAEQPLRLRPGQRLTLLTDGVVEAMSPRSHELFGFERTEAFSGRTAGEIAQAAVDFGGHMAQADDITVMTVALADDPAVLQTSAFLQRSRYAAEFLRHPVTDEDRGHPDV